jgi:hypothetical protein
MLFPNHDPSDTIQGKPDIELRTDYICGQPTFAIDCRHSSWTGHIPAGPTTTVLLDIRSAGHSTDVRLPGVEHAYASSDR